MSLTSNASINQSACNILSIINNLNSVNNIRDYFSKDCFESVIDIFAKIKKDKSKEDDNNRKTKKKEKDNTSNIKKSPKVSNLNKLSTSDTLIQHMLDSNKYEMDKKKEKEKEKEKLLKIEKNKSGNKERQSNLELKNLEEDSLHINNKNLINSVQKSPNLKEKNYKIFTEKFNKDLDANYNINLTNNKFDEQIGFFSRLSIPPANL